MSRQSSQTKACQQVAYWHARALAILGIPEGGLSIPEVSFDLKGRAAGQTVYRHASRHCHIRLNDQLLASHTRYMLTQTVPHEVAHAVIYQLHGSHCRPHGPEWRALMQALGVEARVCHDLPARPSRRLPRYRYLCRCVQPVWLTSIRHKRVQKGAVYVCRACRSPLVYQPG